MCSAQCCLLCISSSTIWAHFSQDPTAVATESFIMIPPHVYCAAGSRIGYKMELHGDGWCNVPRSDKGICTQAG